MKQFNWEEFLNKDNKIAVHCKTEEEAKDFCKQMHEHGMKWYTGSSYLQDTRYEIYKDNTCYSSYGTFCNCTYYSENNYTILEWSDYMKKEFTKADLKDGMVVEYREGKRRIVIGNMLIGEDGFLTLNSFDEKLENIFFKEHSITKIYKIKKAKAFNYALENKNLELIWERKETKKMTAEEMRQKLEELTGEKIEVEMSIREKCWEIECYCDKTPCDNCCLSNGRCTWKTDPDDKENIEECYQKIMEQEK